MSPPVRVALMGFTPFERQHLEPALQAPRSGLPVYHLRPDDLPACNLALVDADQEPAVAQVVRQQRLASAVMVGKVPHRGAGAQLARPIHIASVLKALDHLVATAPPMSAAVAQVQEALFQMLQRQRASHVSPDAGATAPAADWPIIEATGVQRRTRHGAALLVGVSDEILRHLQSVLEPLGLKLNSVAGGAQATLRLQHEVYDFVFMATGTANPTSLTVGDDSSQGTSVEWAGDMDGFQTCRLLQRLPQAQPVAPPPTLVLLMDEDNPLNRLRAQRAGADAWLHLPWGAAQLLQIIDERDRWLRQSPDRS